MCPGYFAKRVCKSATLGERIEALSDLEGWLSGGGGQASESSLPAMVRARG